MAAQPHTTRARAWNTAFDKYTDLNLCLEQAQEPQQVEKIGQALAALQDRLMMLPAPSLVAVIRKLEILFEADLGKPDSDGDEKRLVIDDLWTLVREQTQLLGTAA